MAQQRDLTPEEIEEKILHVLTIYPVISYTMLQAALGPTQKSSIWRPVLDKLVEEGRVIRTEESVRTPFDRYNNYQKLSLPGVSVTTGEAGEGGLRINAEE